MNRLNLLSRLSARSVELVWGEVVRITPQIMTPYAVPGPDPTRPMREVRGVVSFQNTDANLEGARRSSTFQGTVVTGTRATRIYLRASVYAGLGFEVLAGDAVELIDTSNDRKGERYSVTRVVISDTGDPVLEIAVSDREP
jgi:hypothetical protein